MLLEDRRVVGTSLVAQWLRLCASTVGGMGSIPGGGTKILHAVQRSHKQTNKQNRGHHSGYPRREWSWDEG